MICNLRLRLPQWFLLYILFISGIVNVSKGNRMNLYLGTVMLHSAILLHYALMNLFYAHINPAVKSFFFHLMFYHFFKDVALNTWTRESVNMFGSNQIVLAAFFFYYPANDCIFYFIFFCTSCTTVSPVSQCAQRRDAAQWRTESTDCLTDILRMLPRTAGLYACSLTQCDFFGPEAGSTIGELRGRSAWEYCATVFLHHQQCL